MSKDRVETRLGWCRDGHCPNCPEIQPGHNGRPTLVCNCPHHDTPSK